MPTERCVHRLNRIFRQPGTRVTTRRWRPADAAPLGVVPGALEAYTNGLTEEDLAAAALGQDPVAHHPPAPVAATATAPIVPLPTAFGLDPEVQQARFARFGAVPTTNTTAAAGTPPALGAEAVAAAAAIVDPAVAALREARFGRVVDQKGATATVPGASSGPLGAAVAVPPVDEETRRKRMERFADAAALEAQRQRETRAARFGGGGETAAATVVQAPAPLTEEELAAAERRRMRFA